MKPNYPLAALGFFLFCSLAFPAMAAEAARPTDDAAAKASLKVIEATWGSKYKGARIEHCADVADRVTDLLLIQGHFKVKPWPLRSDPWPNHVKFLYLRYQVFGVAKTVILNEGHEVTLRQLIKETRITPPHMDEIPAELENSASLDSAPKLSPRTVGGPSAL